jgi:cytochrome c peroxidase
MKFQSIISSFMLVLLLLFLCSMIQQDKSREATTNQLPSIPKAFPKPFYTFQNNALKSEAIALGRQLFYDPILSQDSSISCASCHQQASAFANAGFSFSEGIYKNHPNRNTPALQNLIWNTSFHWDGGVNNLEVQPINPITNSKEMGESLSNVIVKLNKQHQYRKQFYQVYQDSIISSEKLLKALAQFTSTLISCQSKFDQVSAGKAHFSETEQEGFKLFKTVCANCHAGVLLTDNSFRNNGLSPDTFLNDKGLATISKQLKDAYLFRVPTLRNCEVTYPYMHDGRFTTLEQVIDHYSNRSNFEQHYDLSMNKIGTITPIKKKALISFLKTLTDTAFLQNPNFAQPK